MKPFLLSTPLVLLGFVLGFHYASDDTGGGLVDATKESECWPTLTSWRQHVPDN